MNKRPAPDFAAMMAILERIMCEDRDILRALAAEERKP
jgi:hypothetical protein